MQQFRKYMHVGNASITITHVFALQSHENEKRKTHQCIQQRRCTRILKAHEIR